MKNNFFLSLPIHKHTRNLSRATCHVLTLRLSSCKIFNTDSQIQGNTIIFIPFVQKSACRHTHSGVTDRACTERQQYTRHHTHSDVIQGACIERHTFVNTLSRVTKGAYTQQHTSWDSKRAHFARPYSPRRQSAHKDTASARTLLVHKYDHRRICTGKSYRATHLNPNSTPSAKGNIP